eukprot:2644758-Rhodomonas_salina.2
MMMVTKHHSSLSRARKKETEPGTHGAGDAASTFEALTRHGCTAHPISIGRAPQRRERGGGEKGGDEKQETRARREGRRTRRSRLGVLGGRGAARRRGPGWRPGRGPFK